MVVNLFLILPNLTQDDWRVLIITKKYLKNR